MLHWVYTAIVAVVGVIIVIELFQDRKWRNQLAYAIILIPFILRLLQIK